MIARPVRTNRPIKGARAGGWLPVCLLVLFYPGPALTAGFGIGPGTGFSSAQAGAPVAGTPPQSLSFATTVGTSQLQMMLTVHPNPVLVDVVKIPWRQGRFVGSEPHENIPGSVWLPAAGLGSLPEPWVRHVKEVLDEATGNNPQRGIVFYCKSDCWLSWNAARRAHALGFERIFWYRDGVDGWREIGLRFADADPIAPEQVLGEVQ